MKKHLLYSIFTALFFIIVAYNASAQRSAEHKPITGGISLGYGWTGYLQSNSKYELFAGRQKSMVALAYSSLSHNEVGQDEIHNLKDTMHVLELRYGRFIQLKKFEFKVSTGVSLVSFKGRGEFLSSEQVPIYFFFEPTGKFRMYKTYAKRTENAFGVPLSGELNFLPGKYYGLGLEVFANFNRIHSYAGLSLHVHLGKLRS